VARLVDQGFAHRLLLASDRNRVHELHAGRGTGYDYLLTHFVPKLRRAGVDEASVARMLVANPAEIFALPAPPRQEALP
jgi:phosphotriesterase-related protein